MAASPAIHHRPVRHHRRSLRQFFQVMGPGIVSGAADNDPSGVITYIQIGATTGFSLLWLMLLSTPILYCLEEMSTRIGVVAKRGLTHVLCARYGRRLAAAVVLPVVASNMITIGADLVGTASGAQLLTGIAWTWWIVPIAGGLAYLLVAASYRALSRVLLVLTPLFLLYVAAGILVRPDWGQVLRATLLPSVQLTPTFVSAALGLLGATLTPYMFFWQTTEAVESHETVADLADANLDVAGGMIYANLVFYFIILTSAAVLMHHGGIDTVAGAAAALRPVAGSAASALFAVGIVTSGILSVPVMAASSAYALCEIFGWHEGLSRTVRQARGFYVLLGASLVLGVAIGLLRVPPVALMFWSQVLNGVVLAPLIAVLILLSTDRRVVHEHRSPPLARAVGWGTVALSTVLAALTVWQLVAGG